MAEEKQRESREIAGKTDRDKQRENSSGKKKKLYLYVIESDGIVLEELGESFQNLFNPKHH